MGGPPAAPRPAARACSTRRARRPRPTRPASLATALLPVLLLAPVLSGCFLLGPGDLYDLKIESEAVGHVLVEGTPASGAEMFLSITDAAAEEPVPPNATTGPRPAEPGTTLTLGPNVSKAIVRLPLDGQGRVTVRVPVDHPRVVAVLRIVEDPPPFPVREDKCPSPRRLRSSLQSFEVTEDRTVELPFFLVCGGEG